MASEIGHAALGIYPSFDGFDRKLDAGTSKAMMTAGTSGGTKFGDAAGRSAGSRFGSVFKTAAKASLVGLAALGAGAIAFGKSAVDEAREGQKVAALTAAVIKSTGGAAKVTEKQVGDLATRLSEKAGVDDELIQSGANVLLTFTKIRNEVGAGNDIFDQATLATLNMSAALKTDMSSAAIQMGKALNDPVKGITALGRAGVSFSEDQKKAIEKMVESGDVMGAQKVILEEMNTQFKGAAESQADEADKLKVAWDNFKEEVGEKLLPVLDDLAVFLRKKGIPAVRDFADWFEDEAVPKLKAFGGYVKDEIFPVVKDLAGFLVDVGKFGGDAFKFFNNLPSAAKIAAIGAVVGGAGYMKLRGGGGLAGGVGSALGLAKPVPVFVTNPGFSGGGGRAGGKAGLLGLGAAGGPIVGIAAALSLFAVAAKTWADSIEKRTPGLEEFGTPNNPLEPQVLTPTFKGVKSDFDPFAGMRESLDGFKADFKAWEQDIPKELQSRFRLLGVPETERELRHIMDVYDIAAKDRKTTLELLGYDPLLDRIRNVARELDWAARPREARISITRAYSNAGYQTAGGLVEGSGTDNYGNATKRMGE